jgi:hypothetical protein
MNRAISPVTEHATRGLRDEVAALNNAEWCAAVWRSHGLIVEQAHGLWFCRGPAPQYYPNVVTVDRAADPLAQADFIAGLAGAAIAGLFVKDSFDCLDLASAGFGMLFEAQWLWLETPRPSGASEELRWGRIAQEPQLARWERAWRGAYPNPQRIFRADLLEDDRVRMLACFDAAGEIVGGGVALKAAGAEGITNVFGPRQAFVDALAAELSGSPIVCYEQGDDLTEAVQAGFEPLGGLRIRSRPAR